MKLAPPTQKWLKALGRPIINLFPPNVHRSNASEHAICTLKAYFLAILSKVDPTFPSNMWDKLLPQTQLTLNLLHQETLNPHISAREYFNGPFRFGATPLGPIGSRIIFHNKRGNRKSWDQLGRESFSLGPSLDYYRCFSLLKMKSNAVVISDTVKLLHSYLTQPSLTKKDRFMHALNLLTCAIKGAPSTIYNTQLQAINNVCQIFEQWRCRSPALSTPSTDPILVPTDETSPWGHRACPKLKRASRPNSLPISRIPMSPNSPAVQPPRVRVPTSKGVHSELIAIRARVRTATPATNAMLSSSINPTSNAPVEKWTRSHTLAAKIVSPQKCASHIYPQALLTLWDIPILDKTMGQIFNYLQLRNHRTLSNTCNT